MTPALARALNGIGLLALSLVLGAAFADQFLNQDLPCPLCLLQRAGFAAAGVGIALNVAIAPRPSHYAMAIVSAAAGAAVSLRQIALHIVPGTGAYGDALLGMHYYTWAFVVFGLVVIGSALMLMFDGQFRSKAGSRPVPLAGLSLVAFTLFALIVLANAVSTVAECELGLCPDNPTSYELLNRGAG